MALNPIIEAFLAAREQASRDFAGSENRRLQGEQQAEQAKQFKEQIAQQLKIHTNELAQRKALADAEHALTKQQLEQSALIQNRQQSLGAATHTIDLITKGLVNPYKTDLAPGQAVTVGQPGQMEGALQNIPAQAPGFDPTIDTGTGLFKQLGLPTTLVPNTDAFARFFPGGAEEAKAVISSSVSRDAIRKQMIEDAEIKQALAIQEAVQKEEALLPSKEKLEGIKTTGKIKVEEAKSKAAAGLQEVKGENALEVARIRANATLGAAGIRAAKSASKYTNSLIDSDFRPFIAGERSYDDLKVYPQAVRVALMKGMDENGLKFLNKQDQKLLDRAGIISETQRNVQDLVKLYDDGYVKNFGKIRAKQAAIDSVLGNLARGVSGEAGVLTQSDIERIRGIVPTFVGGKLGTNKLQAEQLSKYTKSTFGHILNGMRDEQAEPIVNRYGLTGSGIWNPKKPKFTPEQMREMTGGTK